MKEKQHPIYKHLIVSSDGSKIYSKIKNKCLRLRKNDNGYMIANVTVGHGKYKKYRVHRLVAETFLGYRDTSWDVHHKDHDKTNNDVSNLMWCDRSYNILCALDEGVNPSRGETHHHAIHNEEVIQDVCRMLQEGYRNMDIASELGVGKGVVAQVKRGDLWVHISKDYTFNTIRKDRLSLDTIHKICSMLEDGISPPEISDKLGVVKETVYRVYRRQTYTRVSKDYLF